MPETTAVGEESLAPGPERDPGGTVSLPVAALALVVAVVVALLAVWGSTLVSAERLPVGPAREPPAAVPTQAATALTVDERKVSFEELEVTLPGAPYTGDGLAYPVAPSFASLTYRSAVVHADFDGQGHNWIATAGVALLDDSLVGADLAATTKAAFEALVDASFTADDHPVVTHETSAPAQIPAPSGSAYSYDARVEVSKQGLATPYDKLVVVVVKLEGGRYAMFYSDFPHDGSREALDAVTDSFATLSAQS